jgi:glycosyltransferase involved in cell wall biosynthesis
VSAGARTILAFIEGFRRPAPSQAHGTHQSAYLTCQAIAREARHSAFHVYREPHRTSPAQGELVLPPRPPTTVFEKPWLHFTREKYAAIYVANGEQILCAPHVLRPKNDWAPVICSVGTAQATGQWANLHLALASGAVRPTDGLIFKSQAAARLFAEVGEQWSRRFGVVSLAALPAAVIPNGVDVENNRPSETFRRQTRDRFGIEEADIVYLSFSRLDPGTKGDLEALIVRWQEVVARAGRALLVLAGMAVDRAFVADLRQVARAAGVGDRVLILDNPFELEPQARVALMSAADVFLHLSTGAEEGSALAVHEAMAHALPVIATAWAGMPEVVTPETGFLIETRNAPLVSQLATLFGEAQRTHLLHASRVIACDWRAFVNACAELAQADCRRGLGATARRRAEVHDVRAMARRYLEFFDATAELANKAWTGAQPWRPLLELNQVLDAQATRRLDPEALVRIGDQARVDIVLRGLYPEIRDQVQMVLAPFAAKDQLSLGELARAAAAYARSVHPADLGPEPDLAIAARLLVRLLNVGVLKPL